MSESISIEARYMRRKQEGQYEPAEAEVRTVRTVTVTPETNEAVELDYALAQVKAAVDKVLGLKPNTGSKGGLSEKVQTVPETPKAKPGRPTKAQQEAKKLAEKALAKANDDPMADVEEDDQPNISKGDDNERLPPGVTEVASDGETIVPADDDVDDMGLPVAEKQTIPDKKYTDKELQNEAGKAVHRLGNSKKVRDLITKYSPDMKSPSIASIPQKQRDAFYGELKELKLNK